MPLAVIYIAAGIMFLGVAPVHLPLGFYTVLGIVATGSFIWAFLVAFTRDKSLLPWIYLLFAVVFNPIMKIPLSHDLWLLASIAAGALLLLTQNKIKQQSTTKVI
jgi:hypothetical protein